MIAPTEAWLLGHAVRGDAVLSWVNPEHPGYAYPEAAGLLLRWFGPQPRLSPVASRLRHDVQSRTVGRGGSRYAFDTGVALAGLEAFAPQDAGALDEHWATLAVWLRTQEIVRPARPAGHPTGAPRWSTYPGPHMLKLAVGASATAWECPGKTALLAVLREWPVDQHSDGRIETPPHAASYLHAHAYAAEGLLASAAFTPAHRTIAEQAVAFLAKVQHADGGLPAWHDGRRPSGPVRADATAQAVRLFQLVDPSGLDTQIRRGLACLEGLSTSNGALRYDENSRDINTWATLFALQARRWAACETASATELL